MSLLFDKDLYPINKFVKVKENGKIGKVISIGQDCMGDIFTIHFIDGSFDYYPDYMLTWPSPIDIIRLGSRI